MAFKWTRTGWLMDLLSRSVDGIEFTKGRSNALLQRWTLNLNAAGAQTVSLAGNFIYGFSGTDTLANVDLQFSRRDTDQDFHPLVEGFGYVHPFDKLHITWAAQAGKTLTILIGNLAPELLNITDNRSAIAQAALLQRIIEKLNEGLALASDTRIEKSAEATNATVILHTVTAGKTFHLTGASLCESSTAAGNAELIVRNVADVTQYMIFKLRGQGAASYHATSLPFFCAVKIPAGYDIVVNSNPAGMVANGFICGWED